MLKEVMFKRLSKAVKEKAGSLSLPDLIMVDGGKGQYSGSREVLNELGLHEMNVRLHPEVSATIVLNVARSAEEAELQADGKSIQELAAEEEAAAEFEIAELFDDMGAAASEDFEADNDQGAEDDLATEEVPAEDS